MGDILLWATIGISPAGVLLKLVVKGLTPGEHAVHVRHVRAAIRFCRRAF
jgi:hypothetical protein